jgi:hypothetical protein
MFVAVLEASQGMAVLTRLVRNYALVRVIHIPATVVLEPRGRGVLDAPVKPGHDGMHVA